MTDMAVTYGNSLYELAVEEGLAEEMLEDVKAVQLVFSENPDYIKVLKEPSIPKAERKKLIDEAFDGKVQGYLLNLLRILCENGHAELFDGCARQFIRCFNKDNNITEAVVTSAVALDEKQKELLKERLEKMSGKKIILIEKIDRKSIAGLRVELDGCMYDGTASGRLSAIRKKVSDIII